MNIFGLESRVSYNQLSNKFMNLFPLIHRSKKSQSFANPLNGLMFRSDIQPLKKDALSTISYSEAPNTNRNASNISSLKAKSNYKIKLQRLEETPEKETLAAATSSKLLKAGSLFGEKVEKATNRMKSQNSYIYQFPDVEIFPLYLMQAYQDIAKYKMKGNLEKYFRLYFNSNFKHNIAPLNAILEKYLPLLKKYDMLDKEIEKKKWPKEFWEIKKIEELLAYMYKYDKPSEYWMKYLLVLIQLYCVPHPTVRQSSLENLLLLTRQHIKDVFEVEQPKGECVFLLQNGVIIEDFLDIPFSTTRLYLTTKKSTPQQTVKPYYDLLTMIKNYREECKKKGFVGRLRRHFRNEIALNKYNEDTINYDIDFSSKEKERKISLYNAMLILQRKKQNQSNTKTLSPNSPRLKSHQQVWKQQNVETIAYHDLEVPKFAFHLQLNSHHVENQIKWEFEQYHSLCVKENSQMHPEEVYIYILEKHHPVITALMKSTFHILKVKNILETIIGEKLSDDRELSKTTIQWRHFIEISLLSSKHLKKLIEMPDCMQLVRNFVENYLQISDDDYYRDELTAKLYRIIDADSTTLSMMEELIWSWLTQNGFVKVGAVQRELLWTYHERSKTFYLLMVSAIFGTYRTTPLDLAFELMI